jgi:hypothetical protein
VAAAVVVALLAPPLLEMNPQKHRWHSERTLWQNRRKLLYAEQMAQVWEPRLPVVVASGLLLAA